MTHHGNTFISFGGDLAGNTFARVVKKVDQTVNNSNVLVNDNELVIALQANKIYSFFSFVYLTSTTVADWKHNWILPAGASGNMTAGPWASNAAQVASIIESIGISVVNTADIECIMTLGRVIVGGTAGSIQYQFSQNNPVVFDTKCLQGSSLVVWEELP